MTTLEVMHFTDPACPFAFSAEPVRHALRWRYGEQLRWRNRMIMLTAEPGEAEKLAAGAPTLQRLHGMPIDPAPRARPASSEPACRRVVAARLHAPDAENALLRSLRVRGMAGALLDDPELLAAAGRDAGLDPAELDTWSVTAEVSRALAEDMQAARSPSRVARVLEHKLGGPAGERRYTAPSYEIVRTDTGATASVPGFNPLETYEVALGNLAPELERRRAPESVEEILAWAAEPLATAEVAMIAQLAPAAARVALARVATPHAAGADFYWTLSRRSTISGVAGR